MGFLPDDYQPPLGGAYMKFQLGDNRLRILSPAIVGHMFWMTESDGGRKPIRRRMDEVVHAEELGLDEHGDRERVKHFWAFTVWNHQQRQVQILELTQKTIMGSIEGLYQSDDWGDPREYDLNIKKSGAGLDTKYAVMPLPKTPLSDEIRQAQADTPVQLEALFRGDDPFDTDAPVPTGPPSPASAPVQPGRDQARSEALAAYMTAEHGDRAKAIARLNQVRQELFPNKQPNDLTLSDYRRLQAEVDEIPF